ncbi:MAG: ACP phosphodiesterase [Betaproteobacteria bacterium]|nr:ACP phosphodiesterase [Betaproteobacteria bacterium]
MNFLAHAYLAGPDTAIQLGGLIGDFVKGPLPAGLPKNVAAGVKLHRRIDSFADAHPAFLRSRSRISAARRRVAGIMVDLFYDHFLALRWTEFAPDSLQARTGALYALMHEHMELLPPRLQEILPRMSDADWFGSYASSAAIAATIDRMARHRLSRPALLEGGGEELLVSYAGFEADFRAFLPDALAFSGEWLAQHRF